MLDKFDIKYGVRNRTKEKLIFLGVLSILCLSFWSLSDKDMLFEIVLPINLTNLLPLVTSFILLGTAINVFVLSFLILYDIRRFRKTSKRLLIREHRLNSLQTDRILKKLYMFRELISAVLKPKQYNINETQWKVLVGNLGNRQELFSKLKLINLLENKVQNKEALQDSEITFLNDLLFDHKYKQLFHLLLTFRTSK